MFKMWLRDLSWLNFELTGFGVSPYTAKIYFKIKRSENEINMGKHK